MKTRTVPYDQLNFLPQIVSDYLADKEHLADYYSFTPDSGGLTETIRSRSYYSVGRALLSDVFMEQSQAFLDRFPLVRSNIAALKDVNTYTVTTGHQLCLFTGPLYFVYKIISTINLARQMTQENERIHIVPVFWMASEDHDFAEVNHTYVFDKKLEWQLDAKGAVGRLSTDSLQPLLAELQAILGEEELAKELIDMMQAAYRPGRSLSEATRELAMELFGQYGLVVLDADDARLKKQFSGIMEDELLNGSTYKLVQETSKELQKNYKLPVNPREINLFYLQEGLRERIVRKDSGFEVLNTDLQFSEEEMLAELQEHPERFSPNVIMRTLYQERVLPNVAYIGGPGEVNYWLQFKKTFDYHQVSFPVVMLRNSVLWVDGKTAGKLDKLGIRPEELGGDIHALINRVTKEQAGTDLDLGREKQRLSATFADILQKAENIDASLKGAVEAEQKKQLAALESLEKKLLKTEKRKHVAAIGQLENMAAKLFPGGAPQERHDNFMPYYLRHGQAFIQQLSEELDPLAFEMVVVSE